MTHMTKDLDGICDMKDALMRKVRGKMDDLDVERSTIQDVQGMDMMINMIHHLAEAEKCCWEACYYKTVVKAMKEGYDVDPMWEDDEDDDMEHADTTRRSYPRTTRGNRRGEWRQNRNSDGEYMEGGVMQHTDMMDAQSMCGMRDMTPDERLNHLKTDVETMWRDATPEQRKRIKESLTKWSTTLTV